MSNFEIHKQNEIKKLDIEVKALIALVNQDVIRSMRIDAVQRLHEIAFPMALAEKINEYNTLKDKRLFNYLENTE